MLIKRLPIVLFFLIKALEAAVSSLNDLDNLAPSISILNSHLPQLALEDGALKEQTESPKSLLSFFEISEKIEKLTREISTLDTKAAVETIEKGLVQILDSGACLHDIAPAIGSLPIDARKLVLAAVENEAYTLLKLLQKAYIWCDERQHHWFKALSYESLWYDKDMWENPEPFPLDWEKNLWAVFEADNVALLAILRKKSLQENALEDFAKLLPLCIEYDSVEIFKFTKLDPALLKEHLELLAKNSSAKLLQLYQTHTKTSHLHLEEFPFPEKLPATVDGFKFLLDKGHEFLPMNLFIEESCKKGRLDLLEHLQKLNPVLIPDVKELVYAAEKNFRDILDWSLRFMRYHSFAYNSVCMALLVNCHFDTLFWWIETNNFTLGQLEFMMIVESGALKVLQWATDKRAIKHNAQFLTDVAAENHHFPILDWLYEEYGTLPNVKFLASADGKMLDWIKTKSHTSEDSQLAIRLNGTSISYEDLVQSWSANFELLRWVFENAPLSVFDEKRNVISKNMRSKEMMMWLYENLKICPSDLYWACEAGDLEAIQWAVTNFDIHPTENDARIAAQKGHFHIITWIHKNLYPKHPSCLSVNTLQTSMSFVRLEIAEYLVSNVFPEALIEITPGQYGRADQHLARLGWFYSLKPASNQPSPEIREAAQKEDIQTLELLFGNVSNNEPDFGGLWDVLAQNNLHKSYRWFLEKFPRNRVKGALFEDLRIATQFGSLGIVKVIHEIHPRVLQAISSITFPRDVTKTTFHIYKWLASKGYQIDSI